MLRRRGMALSWRLSHADESRRARDSRLRQRHERYALEWLEQQAAGAILDVVDAEDDVQRFVLPAGHAEALLDEESLNYASPCGQLLVAAGMTNHEVSLALFIATGTVRKHLDNIYAKLGARSRAQAVMMAAESLGEPG